MVAKRSVKFSRHPFARGANQEARHVIGAVEHVQRRRHLAAAVQSRSNLSIHLRNAHLIMSRLLSPPPREALRRDLDAARRAY
jgi:hypothetical protein